MDFSWCARLPRLSPAGVHGCFSAGLGPLACPAADATITARPYSTGAPAPRCWCATHVILMFARARADTVSRRSTAARACGKAGTPQPGRRAYAGADPGVSHRNRRSRGRWPLLASQPCARRPTECRLVRRRTIVQRALSLLPVSVSLLWRNDMVTRNTPFCWPDDTVGALCIGLGLQPTPRTIRGKGTRSQTPPKGDGTISARLLRRPGAGSREIDTSADPVCGRKNPHLETMTTWSRTGSSATFSFTLRTERLLDPKISEYAFPQPTTEALSIRVVAITCARPRTGRSIRS